METFAYSFKIDLDTLPDPDIDKLAYYYNLKADSMNDLRWLIALKHASDSKSIKGTMPGAIQKYYDLEDKVWAGKAKLKCSEMIETIKDYVRAVYASKKDKWLANEIKSAPKLKNMRVYRYEPGTNKPSEQFYKFAKAIAEGEVTCKNIKSEALQMLIHNYRFDQIE